MKRHIILLIAFVLMSAQLFAQTPVYLTKAYYNGPQKLDRLLS